MLETALDLIKDILEKVQDAAGNSGVTTTLTGSLPTSGSGPLPTPIPNADTAARMDLSCYSNLFTEEEFDMLKKDPVCFFANYERLYEGYANYEENAKKTASGATTTMATAAAKRSMSPRDGVLGPLGPVTDSGSCAEVVDARTLYLSYLPDQLRLVYNWTPDSLVVTATSTTTCSGIGDLSIVSFETPYVEFGPKPGYKSATPSPAAATPSPSSISNSESVGAAASISPSILLACAVAGMVSLPWLL